MLKPFLYNSVFITKFIKLLCVKGTKERLENKILVLFKKLDYFLLFEFIYNLRVSFKFFSLKKQTGRHTFVRSQIMSYVKLEEQLIIALKVLNNEVSSKKFSYEQSFKLLSEILLNNQIKLYNLKLQKKKQAIFLQKLHHYRW